MKHNLRRKVLKTLAVGAPAIWIKPIVHSVVLPVHAQFSPACAIDMDGPMSIAFTQGITIPGPLVFSFTNVSEAPITGGILVGTLGGGTFFTKSPPANPSPFTLNPGDSTSIELTNLSTNNCPTTGSGNIFFRVSVDGMTLCEYVVTISCQVPG